MSTTYNTYTLLFTYKRRCRRRRAPNTFKPTPNRRLTALNHHFITPWRNFIVHVVSEDLDDAAAWLQDFSNFFVTIFLPYIVLPSVFAAFTAPFAITALRILKGLVSGIQVLKTFVNEVTTANFLTHAAYQLFLLCLRILILIITLFRALSHATSRTKATTAIPAITLLLLAITSPQMGTEAASIMHYPIPDNMPPAPITTDSPIVKEASHVLRFRDLGPAAVQKGKAYLRTSIGIQDAICKIYKLDWQMQQGAMDYRNQYKHMLGVQWNNTMKDIKDDMASIVTSMGLTSHIKCDFFPGHHRSRRSIMPALIAIGGGLLNQVRMRRYKNIIEDNRDKINTVVATVERHQTILHQLSAGLRDLTDYVNNELKQLQAERRLTYALNRCHRVVDHFRHVANVLNDGRLEATLVHPSIIDKLLVSIQNEVADQRLQTPNINTLALGGLPTSWYIEEGVLEIMVEIPLISSQWSMSIKKINLLPFQIGQQFVDIQTDKQYLLLGSPSALFATLTEAEFAQCKVMGGTTICPLEPRLQKKNARLEGIDHNRCLFALSQDDYVGAKTHCPLTPASMTEKVVYVGKNNFAVFTTESMVIQITCGPNKPKHRARISHMATVYLPPGCEADTPSGFFWGNTEIDTEPEAAATSIIGEDIIEAFIHTDEDDLTGIIMGSATIETALNETVGLLATVHDRKTSKRLSSATANIMDAIYFVSCFAYTAFALASGLTLMGTLHICQDMTSFTTRLRRAASIFFRNPGDNEADGNNLGNLGTEASAPAAGNQPNNNVDK